MNNLEDPFKIPVFDLETEEGEADFELALHGTLSSSDYRNDRDRPYNGQPHTHNGIRGKTEVKGLTMRDVADCIVQGFLASSKNTELQRKTKEISEEFKGTEYANKNTWRCSDLYELDMEDLDPVAVIQNTICFIEDMMGIFPNVPAIEPELNL